VDDGDERDMSRIEYIKALLEPMHQIVAVDEPEARECDDCGIEDGARWDVGKYSLCGGCKDSFGYDN